MTKEEKQALVQKPENEQITFDEFKQIIAQLRAKDGCPWDREQTHESLRQCMLEEAYEAADAIDMKDMENLKEELGDMMLQVMLHAQIAEENGEFTLADIIDGIGRKMIRRHPHVFGSARADSASDVLVSWEEIKKQEKHEAGAADGMKRVAKALPANIRAQKVQKKAAAVGYDFADTKEVLQKVHEELEELENAMQSEDHRAVEEEFGDLMFSMINLSRFLKVNAENSLTNATEKFINRLDSVENLARERRRALTDMSVEALDKLWEEVKEQEHL